MARPKSNTVAVTVRLQTELAAILRATVAENGLNLSSFVQDAVARALRNRKSPVEFIATGRDKTDKEPLQGPLSTKLDRQDGVPLAYADETTESDWRTLWKMMSENYMQLEVNRMRRELGRELLTEPEWKAIVQHMGCLPGLGRQVTTTELTEC